MKNLTGLKLRSTLSSDEDFKAAGSNAAVSICEDSVGITGSAIMEDQTMDVMSCQREQFLFSDRKTKKTKNPAHSWRTLSRSLRSSLQSVSSCRRGRHYALILGRRWGGGTGWLSRDRLTVGEEMNVSPRLSLRSPQSAGINVGGHLRLVCGALMVPRRCAV